MVSVNLGGKAKNYNFDVSNVDLNSLEDKDSDYSIGAGSITISENKSDYVTLEGKFSLFSLMGGNYEKGIKRLDAITVVEDGKVSYTATGLGMTGKDAATGAVFKQFLAGEDYSIKGNAYANTITGADHNDAIQGSGGDDTLRGMGGDDRLSGDAGNDNILGGQGSDSLSGGLGRDTFVFVSGDGADVISDFTASGRSHDLIDLSGHADVSSFDDLVISRSGSSLKIEIGDDTLLLKHVSETKIDATDFLF